MEKHVLAELLDTVAFYISEMSKEEADKVMNDVSIDTLDLFAMMFLNRSNKHDDDEGEP